MSVAGVGSPSPAPPPESAPEPAPPAGPAPAGAAGPARGAPVAAPRGWRGSPYRTWHFAEHTAAWGGAVEGYGMAPGFGHGPLVTRLHAALRDLGSLDERRLDAARARGLLRPHESLEADVRDAAMGRPTGLLVMRFQGERGLPETGAVDFRTLLALDEALAAAGAPLAPPPPPRPGAPPRDFAMPQASGALRLLDPAAGGITGRDTEFEALAAHVGGARDVTVSVIDTKAYHPHQALLDNRWENAREAPGNGIDDDGNGYVDDRFGWNFVEERPGARLRHDGHDFHGTHVAGIAAYGTHRVKVMGLGVLKPVSMLGALFGTFRPPPPEVLARAIAYAREQGARVVNLSLGGAEGPEIALLREAMAASPDLLFVISAGNVDRDIDAEPIYPASLGLPNMVVVASVDREGNLGPASAWGRTAVDIAAIGTAVESTTLPRDPDGREGPDGGWVRTASGTSMSAPLVSNVVAKMLSLCPSLHALEAKQLVLATADRAPHLEGFVRSGGLVSPLRAYRAAALIARVEGGAPLTTALAALPGVTAEEMPRVGQAALGVLAARARARAPVPP